MLLQQCEVAWHLLPTVHKQYLTKYMYTYLSRSSHQPSCFFVVHLCWLEGFVTCQHGTKNNYSIASSFYLFRSSHQPSCFFVVHLCWLEGFVTCQHGTKNNYSIASSFYLFRSSHQPSCFFVVHLCWLEGFVQCQHGTKTTTVYRVAFTFSALPTSSFLVFGWR